MARASAASCAVFSGDFAVHDTDRKADIHICDIKIDKTIFLIIMPASVSS